MRDESGSSCRVCRAPLPAATRGRPPVYCSRACQARAYRRRKNPPPAAEPDPPAGRPSRRLEIVEALWRIAAERGLEAASMREIAAEAGVSLRVVQYHFDGKHQLLVTALRLLHRDGERRARARIEAVPDPSDLRALLWVILTEFLPLDDRSRTTLRVLLAYYVRSLTDPALAAVFLHGGQPLEDLVAGIVGRAQREGKAAPGLDPRHEADLLVGGVSGLGMDVLHGRRTVAEVRRTVDYHLDRIFTVPAASGAPAETSQEVHLGVRQSSRQ
ncbi:TetR/AcrR family transcriptional regulator [Streptosporangium sp. NPDC050855]|uniref:TetR/AcrR family transcriptional regulator n=1 Tax=Streptosporangium sp. NPDC050855 TaxID=3366194 RepID=UPI0037891145